MNLDPLPASVALQRRPQPSAPPVEAHIVATALAAQNLQAEVSTLLFLLQTAPRDGEAMRRHLEGARVGLNRVWEYYSAYDAVRTCEGQA